MLGNSLIRPASYLWVSDQTSSGPLKSATLVLVEPGLMARMAGRFILGPGRYYLLW